MRLTTAMAIACLSFVVLSMSCSKDHSQSPKYQCAYSILYLRGANVGFIGYEPHELDTIEVKMYDSGKNFDTVRARVVINQLPNYQAGDTCYFLDSNYYARAPLFINQKYDYTIKILSEAKTHAITRITSGPNSVTYESNDPCNKTDRPAEIAPYSSVQVDAERQMPVSCLPDPAYTFFVFIKK